ncbi:MAG: hypothetical protein ACREOO_14425, partial [bacterium]
MIWHYQFPSPTMKLCFFSIKPIDTFARLDAPKIPPPAESFTPTRANSAEPTCKALLCVSA